MEKDVKIGLEIHCQLTALKSKMFCGCSSDYRGKAPNSSVCPICLGLPGSLPAINEKTIDLSIMVALALNSEIAKETLFFRKNYYYPDLPKNFQISQYDKAGGVPIASNGKITFTVNMKRKAVAIRRIHLEEDPGKLYYLGSIDVSPYALVDYNRAGIALLEIVTEPEFESPREARVFLQKIRSILEHLDVSDGSLEGSMRCDTNISLAGGLRIEIKNISSFKEVERALNFEIIRQRTLLNRGVSIRLETRHWDEARRVTVSLRTKEEEQDYRYFPEPDLVPMHISKEQIEKMRYQIPELPDARKLRFIKNYNLPQYDAEVLTSDRSLADFFEKCITLYNKPKPVANWLMGDVLQCLHSLELDLPQSKIKPEHLAEMLTLMDEGVISIKIAKKLLWDIMKTGKMPSTIVKEKGMVRITDVETLGEFSNKVFSEYPKAVQDALTDENAVHYLVGQLMALSKGKADPELTNRIVREKLQTIRNKQFSGSKEGEVSQ
ncbi:MAG: Asp-tRNA(Asn)/Glu-tRNA(Gln) amidotransferase subunit GatB [Candidatus Bathyarchaeota archaeon]